MYLAHFDISSCVLNSEMPVASRCHIIEQFNSGKYDIIIASDEQNLEETAAGTSQAGTSKRQVRTKIFFIKELLISLTMGDFPEKNSLLKIRILHFLHLSLLTRLQFLQVFRFCKAFYVANPYTNYSPCHQQAAQQRQGIRSVKGYRLPVCVQHHKL